MLVVIYRNVFVYLITAVVLSPAPLGPCFNSLDSTTPDMKQSRGWENGAELRPLGHILLYYQCVSGMYDEYKALREMIKTVYQHDSTRFLHIHSFTG